VDRVIDRPKRFCNGQVKPDTFLDSLPIKIPLILQRGFNLILNEIVFRCKKPNNR
jgi:hypothetical protein